MILAYFLIMFTLMFVTLYIAERLMFGKRMVDATRMFYGVRNGRIVVLQEDGQALMYIDECD